ncbi:MAG: DUF1028 domain-containing protein [Candidatus Eisenbacteria sp.]|nr:DUF1028 domain-containing protein [Candidatus Eisenbacteria bacterium]
MPRPNGSCAPRRRALISSPRRSFAGQSPFLILLLIALTAPSGWVAAASQPIATFSIVGYDPDTGDLGVAVQSKFFAVGAVVPYAQAVVGAIASQAFGNTTFGPFGLGLLAKGLAPEAVLEELLAADSLREQRQVGIVDAQGRAAAFTGEKCMEWAGHLTGENFAAQGNILVSEETVAAMAQAFRETDGILGEKLIRALEAGQAAGGDSRGVQSAAMLIVRAEGGYAGYNDRYCDLRVDDHEHPIAELRRIFNIWQEHALILEGYRLCDENRYTEAFATGKRMTELYPRSGEAFYHYACYYSKAGHFGRALNELQRAVKRDASLGERAKKDTDFEPLWEEGMFLEIVGR